MRRFGIGTAALFIGCSIADYDDAGNTNRYHAPGSAHAYGLRYDALNMITEESVDNSTTSYFVYTPDEERLRIESAHSGTSHWRIRGLDKKVLCDIQRSGSAWNVSREYVHRDAPSLTPVTASTAVRAPRFYSLFHDRHSRSRRLPARAGRQVRSPFVRHPRPRA